MTHICRLRLTINFTKKESIKRNSAVSNFFGAALRLILSSVAALFIHKIKS